MPLGLIISTDTIEFLVFVVLNSSVTLSKVETRRTSDKAVILQSCFLNVLPKHADIMAGRAKGLVFLMNVQPDVYICPLKKRVYLFLLRGHWNAHIWQHSKFTGILTEINECGIIAKARILVKQDTVKQLEIFSIISSEMPISILINLLMKVVCRCI